MNNKNSAVQDDEIDLLELARVLWRRVVLIAAAALVCGAVCFCYARFMVTPQYEASVLMYVNNSSLTVGSTSVRISSGELSAAQSLVDTYSVILETRNTLSAVAEKAGVNYSYSQLKSMISSEAVNSTEVFQITVRDTNPEEAKLIANTIADVLPDKISEIVDNSSVRVVDYAVTPQSKVAPSYTKYTAIGILIGLVVSCAIVLVRYFMDDVIRTEEYLTDNYDIPVLASIPNLHESSSGAYAYSYGYGYGGKQKQKK